MVQKAFLHEMYSDSESDSAPMEFEHPKDYAAPTNTSLGGKENKESDMRLTVHERPPSSDHAAPVTTTSLGGEENKELEKRPKEHERPTSSDHAATVTTPPKEKEDAGDVNEDTDISSIYS